jgi:hypothetical protein
MALRLPGTTATISGWVFSVAQVPIGASNARSGTDTGTNMPTHRGPAEHKLPWQPTPAASRSSPSRACYETSARSPVNRPPFAGCVGHVGGRGRAPALRGNEACDPRLRDACQGRLPGVWRECSLPSGFPEALTPSAARDSRRLLPKPGDG